LIYLNGVPYIPWSSASSFFAQWWSFSKKDPKNDNLKEKNYRFF
jgi:hypothetical protein